MRKSPITLIRSFLLFGTMLLVLNACKTGDDDNPSPTSINSNSNVVKLNQKPVRAKYFYHSDEFKENGLGSGAGTYSLGYEFESDVDGYIDEVAIFPPVSGGSSRVDIWDVTSQTSLNNVNVSRTANEWSSAKINRTKILAGKKYRITVYTSNYFYAPITNPEKKGNITITYATYATGLGFPDNLDDGYIYGLVDFSFDPAQ